jgi:hypothetical protein
VNTFPRPNNEVLACILGLSVFKAYERKGDFKFNYLFMPWLKKMIFVWARSGRQISAQYKMEFLDLG